MTENQKRIAIVTGASSGIGEAIVRKFIYKGFGVVGNARNADKFGPIPVVDDIADAVYYIVSRPPHVHVCDIVVRPTRQDYP